MEKFKISNTSNSTGSVIMFASVIVSFLICMGYLNHTKSSDANAGMLGFLILLLGVVAGVLILRGRNTEVNYDGFTIRLKSVFGKKEIDLSKVKSVSYEYLKGYGRGAYDTICVSLNYYEQTDGVDNHDDLHDIVTRDKVDLIFKGNYSNFPLMQMYEDIIRRYPEKKAPEVTE